MRSAFICFWLISLAIGENVKLQRHLDDLDAINEDFPYQNNPTAMEESVVLGRDDYSGCLCRRYLVEQYVTCYDPVACVKFPKDINFKTEVFRISTTGITVIRKGDFDKNRNLTTLRLESNDHLNRIEPGAFREMFKLVNLTITYNKNLMYLENDTFNGLDNLLYLKLYKNGFPVLKDFTYSLNPISLPKLQRLVIAQMLFPKVDADDFEALENTSVESLNLFTCQIEYIHPASIARFKKLKVLGLGENYLTAENIIEILEMSIKKGIKLQYLSLLNLNFIKLPVHLLNVVAKTNITHLSLSKNRFEIIEAFPSMPNIERLDLSSVIALNITPNAFKLLPKLKTLYLNSNLFSDIPHAVLLPQLKYLDISYSGKYFSLQDEVFSNMSNLTYLDLSGNNIRKLAYNTFTGLEKLKVLGLKESKLFFIENGTFLPTTNLIFLNLIGNPFPTRDLQKSIFQGLENLEVLLLGKCQIGYLDDDLFTHLESLIHLGLEKNNLRGIEAAVLQPLTNLKILDVANNNFYAWDTRMLQHNQNLTTLIAYNNKIRNITPAMIQDFLNLEELDLHSNPFICTCDDLDALKNIVYQEGYHEVFNLLHYHQLNCTYPEEYTNQTILGYLDHIKTTDSCVSYEFAYSVINITLLSIVVVSILSTIIFMYIYRWHIRYWFFLTKIFMARSGRIVTKKRSYTNYEYDAFVSYSNEDQNFVIHLVSMLENTEPRYRLCVYERDFQIGTIITDSILESVAKSRKTLLIVSDAYIKSQWCKWEVQVAENHRIFFENEYGETVNDSLIIVKIGEIQMRNLSPMLRYLMKTRIYLQYDSDPKKQKIFWEKLRNTLAKPKSVCKYISVDT